MKLQYFREIESGDYGAVDTESFSNMEWEGRSTAIEGDITSVCTTMLGNEFLAKYTKEVPKAKVPKKWLRAIEGGN